VSSIFSKIINKEIPASILKENNNFISFMDAFPIQNGHSLVIPKLEIDNILDLPEDTYNGLFSFAREISIAIKKALGCKKVGISVIGFEVPHAHIHLVPMNKISDMNFNNKIITSKEEINFFANKIKKKLKY